MGMATAAVRQLVTKLPHAGKRPATAAAPLAPLRHAGDDTLLALLIASKCCLYLFYIKACRRS
jgi:hypothetical protein